MVKVKKILGFSTPPVIVLYRGYGSQREALVQGHVLKDRLPYETTATDSFWTNLKRITGSFLNQAMAGVWVEVIFLEQRRRVRSDENGFFEARFAFDPPLSLEGEQPVRARIADDLDEEAMIRETKQEVRVVDQDTSLGIISDIDDTVLISRSTQLLPKLKLMLSKNSKTRLPFRGVARFYEALRVGSGGEERNNPFFYVSSSEWNLYDFLEDFFYTQKLPRGPFLLQKLKTSLLELLFSGGGKHDHKLEKIQRLFALYTHMNFILIGDSGQRDAHLYTEIALDHPERVRAIYIRNVSGKEREKAVYAYARQLEKYDIDLLLVANTGAAALHALQAGFINEAQYRKVVEAVGEED